MNTTRKIIITSCISLCSVNVSYAKVTYLHANPMGSMIAATDESGVQVWIKRYTPFGMESRIGEAQDSGSNHGFATHELDTETNLVYMRARYYDPLVGRFYARDPIGFQADKVISFNHYVYAANNGLMFIDPDGEDLVFFGGDLNFLGFGGSFGVFLTYPGGFTEPWDIGLFTSPVISQPGWLDALLPGSDPVVGGDPLEKGFSLGGAAFQFGAEYTRSHFNNVGVDSCIYMGVVGGCGSYNTMVEGNLKLDNLFSGASVAYGYQLGYDSSVSYTQTFSVRDAWSIYESSVDSLFDSADWYSGGDYGSGGSYYGF